MPVVAMPRLIGVVVLVALLMGRVLAQSPPDRFLQLDRADAVKAQIDSMCAWVGPVGLEQQNTLVAQLGDTSVAASPHELLRLLCTRMRLHLEGVFTTLATGVPIGQGWPKSILATGKLVVRTEPQNDTALVVLAVLGLRDGRNQRFGAPETPGQFDYRPVMPIPIGDVLAPIVAAVRRGGVPAFLQRACVSLAIDVGDFVTARDCATRALDQGRDSTWHLMRITATAFWQLDTLLGARAFRLAALASRPGQQSRDELGSHLEALFPLGKECVSCRHDGILNVGPGGAHSLKDGRFSDVERAELRAMSPEVILPWLEAAVQRDDGLVTPSDAQHFHMTSVPDARYQQIWRTADPLTRRLFRHFHRTAYRTSTFRACVIWTSFPRPPCVPRTLPLPDTYIATALAAANIWDPATGVPTTLLTWALGSGDMGRNPGDPDRVTVEWRRSGVETGVTWDSIVALPVPPRPREESWLMAVTPIPSGRAPTVSMILTQGAARRGGVFLDHLAPLDTARIAISDPLLGQVGTGATWMLGADTVPMSPFRVFARKSAVTLTHQVRSDRTIDGARTRVRIVGEDETSGAFARELVTIAFPVAVSTGVTTFRQEITMPDLKSGAYQFEIALLDGDTVRATPRAVAFRVR